MSETVITEALRYLGYRGSPPDEQTAALLEKGYKELSAAAQPRFVYKLLKKEECGQFLYGADIEKHLSASDGVIFFAATLGSGTDKVIRTAEISNMAYALILDALASAMTEDRSEAQIKSKVQGHFTWRFSPGYGDYPISVQPLIIDLLRADKLIGLTVTDSSILLPRKSVTAVIGVSDGDQPQNSKRGCDSCLMREKCAFRKEGKICDNS